MLRIISGERRGHKIEGPANSRLTRPTSDLVRESIFNILGAALVDLIVVDLFAGTGSLGLEALSRGARHAYFVEKRRENAALILRNLATLRFEGRGTVEVANAYTWGAEFQTDPDSPVIFLLDPPYRDYEDRPRKVRELLVNLRERLPVGSILVVEAGRVAREVLPEPELWDVRRYGDTHIAVREIGASVGEPETESHPEPDPRI